MTITHTNPRQPVAPELQAAAQAVLDRWDSPQWEWATHGPTADLMHTLRAAIAQPTDGNRTSVDSGALKLALNVLRRAGKDATADALQETAMREPIAQQVQPADSKKDVDISGLQKQVSSYKTLTESLGVRIATLQAGRAEWQEAVNTLSSERDANAMLTDEIAALREAIAQPVPPPPECKTDAEKTAFAFGWWKAMEQVRDIAQPVPKETS